MDMSHPKEMVDQLHINIYYAGLLTIRLILIEKRYNQFRVRASQQEELICDGRFENSVRPCDRAQNHSYDCILYGKHSLAITTLSSVYILSYD